MFILQTLIVGFSFHGTMVASQRIMIWALLLLLICETVTQYCLYIQSMSQTYNAQEKYKREVQGLLQNTTSFIVFGLKILLIIIQASLIQFQKHLSQLEFIDEAKNLV